MNESEKLVGALGLCARAGKLTYGSQLVVRAVRDAKSRPQLVLQASDISATSAKELHGKCSYYRVPLYRIPLSKNELSGAVGKSGLIAAVGIGDAGLSTLVLGKLAELGIDAIEPLTPTPPDKQAIHP